MEKKILIAGSIAYDYVMNFDGSFEELIMPEEIKNLSVCFLVKDKRVHFGGCGANIVYNLSMLEEHPLLLGVVGRDFENYENWLKKNEINLDNIIKLQDKDTAAAFITTDKKGNQIISFYQGASEENPEINLSHLKDEISMTLIAPDNAERMKKVALECANNNIPYFFDPGQQLPAIPKGTLMEIIDNSKGVFLNEYELEMLLRKLNLSHAQLVTRAGLLITTLGEKGSKLETVTGKLEIGIAKPKQILDPTGCGDAFRAGFLKGLAQELNIERAAKMGALCATYTIENHGTQNHKFTLEEFMERLG